MKSKYGNFVDEYACDFYSERGSLPMFHIVENILKEELKYNNKIQFLNYLMPMLKGGIPLTLEQIAEKCNLTRERVRQICTKGIGYMYREIKPKSVIICITIRLCPKLKIGLILRINLKMKLL